MFDYIAEVQSEPWSHVTTGKLIATSIGLISLFYLLISDEDGFIFLLDHANLAFHEAGHVFWGILGNTLGLYGGTIGQLVFPFVAIVAFWMRRETTSCALGWIWFFENFLNIARYMEDARAQLLPLVGGGEHDWTNIFSRWGVLSYDTAIAGFVKTVAWLGMIAIWVWVVWQWQHDR